VYKRQGCLAMITIDDNDPHTNKPQPRNLEKLSIAELEQYILDLKNEIERVSVDIAKKQAHRDAASSLFKK
jgi:uncharacterized small protein (DUF1192 family)